MACARQRALLAVLLIALVTVSTVARVAHANAVAAATQPTDCSTVTSFEHLEDWSECKDVDSEAIYLLNLYYSASPDTDGIVDALVAGMRAALKAQDYTTVNNQKIVVVNVSRGTTTEDLSVTYVEEAVCCFKERLFGVLGPFNDNRVRELLETRVLFNNDLVALGPYTGSSAVRYYTQSMYFMRADPIAELFTMLNYIINHEQHRRVAFAYLTNRNFGDTELIYGRGYVQRVGSELVNVYAGDGDSDDVDMDAFQALVDSNPQSIVVYTYPGTHTTTFLTLLLSNEKLKDCTIFVPSSLNYLLETAADSVEEVRVTDNTRMGSAYRDRLFSSSTNYPAYSTSMHHIVEFRKDMIALIGDGTDSPYADPAIIDEEPAFSEVMINGWIVGQMVLQIFDHESWVKTRPILKAGLFKQNRYIISEDFVLGDYGGECYSTLVGVQGAMCECNQGGNSVFLMHHFANYSQRIVLDAVFAYSSSTCYAESVWLPSPVNILIMSYNGDERFERISSQLEEAGQLAVESLNEFLVGTADTSYNVRLFPSNVATAQQELDDYMADHRVDIIMGPVLLGTDTGDTLILSPTYRRPHPTFSDPNKVVLRPTLEQQFYIVCNFLADDSSNHVFTKGSQMRVLLRDIDEENTKEITQTIKKTAETFRLKKPKITNTPSSRPLNDVLEKNVVTFVIGLQEDDPKALATYLEQNAKSFVLIFFPDLMLFYDELLEAFRNTSEDVQGRLVFATNYPMWNDDSAEAYQQYPILKAFHKAVGDAKFSRPRAFESYITTRLVEALASSLPTINAEQLKEQLYHMSNFLIDDFRLGPFVNCEEDEKDCVMRNYGANEISIVSIRRVLTPSQFKIFGPVTPAMTYSKRPLSKADIIALCIGCGIALILITVLPIVICMCCCANSRDNKNAPKKVEDPVTIIFTDIESSTALWGTVPQIMPDAVAAHHKLIREIVALHKGYEVKTVGDSFMIACKKPFAAVQIAQDIQKRFLAHDWEEEIDECYRQFEQRKADDPDNETYKPHSANLVRSVYEALWSGLRVRIGVHTGLSDIRQDEITGGFDYYGETSNMAARTEAIGNGGQVLLTDSTWWALSQDERDSLDVTNLGRQGLRGVGWLVEMFQLNSVAMRAYPPLRLDIDAYLPNDDETQGSMSTDGMASSVATLTGPAAAIATVLTNCFSPYPPARRIKELQPLLQKWGIPVPPRHRRVAEEDYCQGLLNRLAVKMSSVVQIRSKMDGTAGSAPLCASGTTAARSRDSRMGSVNTAVNPLTNQSGVGGGLDSRAVKSLQFLTQTTSRRESRRGSAYSGTRLPLTVFSPVASPARSRRNSGTYQFEMVDVVPEGDDAAAWTMRSPIIRPRPNGRTRGTGLAALSVNSEMHQSIHVQMPSHFS